MNTTTSTASTASERVYMDVRVVHPDGKTTTPEQGERMRVVFGARAEGEAASAVGTSAFEPFFVGGFELKLTIIREASQDDVSQVINHDAITRAEFDHVRGAYLACHERLFSGAVECIRNLGRRGACSVAPRETTIRNVRGYAFSLSFAAIVDEENANFDAETALHTLASGVSHELVKAAKRVPPSIARSMGRDARVGFATSNAPRSVDDDVVPFASVVLTKDAKVREYAVSATSLNSTRDALVPSGVVRDANDPHTRIVLDVIKRSVHVLSMTFDDDGASQPSNNEGEVEMSFVFANIDAVVQVTSRGDVLSKATDTGCRVAVEGAHNGLRASIN